uniref:Myeloid-derived growth factor n=1 Tax=Oncorhynchus tshawytscha TaxID=74940 RepID=A0A8C8HHM8_ONCTS
MAIINNLHFLALLFVTLTVALASADDRTKTVEFNVKPGGEVHTFSEKMREYECSFTYASQGGTNEQWLMSVGLSDDDGLFSCSVWRPQGKSYLFFTQFKAELKGAKIEYASAYNCYSTDQRGFCDREESERDSRSWRTQRSLQLSAAAPHRTRMVPTFKNA